MTSLLERLRELWESGQPTPRHIAVMEDGSDHYNDRALVAKMKGAALAWESVPAVVALVQAAHRTVDAHYETAGLHTSRKAQLWDALEEQRRALAPFVSEATEQRRES